MMGVVEFGARTTGDTGRGSPATGSTPTIVRPALLAVVGAATLFGSTGTIASLGPDALPAFAAGVWRSIVGGVVLVAFSTCRRQPVWAFGLLDRWVWIGGVGVAAYQLAFFEAVSRTGVGLGTLITIGVGPPVAGLLDATLHRRAPTRAWLTGTAIAIGGVVLLTAGASDPDTIGIALAVVAACSFPLYGAAAQRLMLDRPFLPAISTVFGAGAVLLVPLAVVTAPDAVASTGSVATVAVLGVATLAVAYVLWGYGLDTLSLSVVVTATLVEPAVAATLAVLVLDEPLTVSLPIGLGLVAVGVRVGAGTRSRPASARHAPTS